MKASPLAIPDVFLIEPAVYSDNRGHFFESFNKKRFDDLVGKDVMFVQDNQSRSVRNVLRGLHYQVNQPQGKLVRVVVGEIFDVAVDIRRSSLTFGRWVAQTLSAENRMQLWVPEGFAHGFLALSEVAEVCYKTTDYYAPEHERCIVWNDPDIGIQWPAPVDPVISEKDRSGRPLSRSEVFS